MTDESSPQKKSAVLEQPLSKQDATALLDQAAIDLAKIITKDDTENNEKVNAFKVLTAYYSSRFGRAKVVAPEAPEPTGDTASFDDFAEQIKEAGNGGGKTELRNRRRHTGH